MAQLWHGLEEWNPVIITEAGSGLASKKGKLKMKKILSIHKMRWKWKWSEGYRQLGLKTSDKNVAMWLNFKRYLQIVKFCGIRHQAGVNDLIQVACPIKDDIIKYTRLTLTILLDAMICPGIIASYDLSFKQDKNQLVWKLDQDTADLFHCEPKHRNCFPGPAGEFCNLITSSMAVSSTCLNVSGAECSRHATLSRD